MNNPVLVFILVRVYGTWTKRSRHVPCKDYLYLTNLSTTLQNTNHGMYGWLYNDVLCETMDRIGVVTRQEENRLQSIF